jgi:hypothetical protein
MISGEIASMRLAILFFIMPIMLFAATGTVKKPATKVIPWISLMDSASWQLTKGFQKSEKWKIIDSAFEGTDSWLGCTLQLADFIIDGEFLYNGKSQGGIVIRGDLNSWLPWLSGYELDIDAADMQGQGHIHFPSRPQPYPGEARFPINEWQQFSIRAIGQSVSVSLKGKEVIKFRDDHFKYGQICLEGDKGGIQYRKLKIRKLDKATPTGKRTPWIDLFDGTTLNNWETSGAVSISNGVMEIDGYKKHAQVTHTDSSFKNGIFEIDAWCKRQGKSKAPYNVGLRAQKDSIDLCFMCFSDHVLSCGKSGCASEFPMFQEGAWPEYWRFILKNQKVEAYRFGEKVLTCTDSTVDSGSITISADSCLLLIRGVRYRSLPKVAQSAVIKKAK